MCEPVLYHDAKSKIGVSTILCVSEELLRLIGAYLQGSISLNVRPYAKNSRCTRQLQSKKIVSKTFMFDFFRSWFLIGLWFQSHSHTPMIHYNLWLWIVVERRQHPLRDVHATFFLLKILQFCNILAEARLRAKTSVKVASHEPNYKHKIISYLSIRPLSQIIFFPNSMLDRLLMCSGYQDEHRYWHLLSIPWTYYIIIELVFCT